MNHQNFTPRDYQIEIAEAAIEENIVACLGTGTGKTFIAVMLIKNLAHQIEPPYEQNGKRTFFLVPTVPLVHQQSDVLKEHLDLKVGKYFGEMKGDFWSKMHWHDQFSKNQILVMTAEIFRTIIEHGFLSLSRVNLIIFDECHRAVKNHPYRAIMRNFDRCHEHPKILGLTASILNGKCKPGQLNKKLKDLETTLRSKAIVPKYIVDMHKYGTKPTEMIISFKDFAMTENESKAEIILQVVMKELPNNSDSPPQRMRDIDSDDDTDSEDFNLCRDSRKYITDVLYVLKNLGQWCAAEIIRIFVREIRLTIGKDLVDKQKLEGMTSVQNAFKTALDLLSEQMGGFNESYLFGEYCHPKLKKLLQILLSKKPLLLYGAQPLCGVVFVQKRLVAFLLNRWFQKLSSFPEFMYIKSNFMVGHGSQLCATEIKEICMASKQQDKMLKDFREGTHNLLIASSVIEEGMDVPHCNIIVRFDPPSDFRAYIQSKGRARAQNSAYLLMTAEGEDRIRLIDDLTNYNSIEKILQLHCYNREPPTEEEIAEHMADEVKEPYMPFPEDGGARVTMSSAISLINRYCSKLGSNSFSEMAPTWKINKVDVEAWEAPGYRCILQLPVLSHIREPIVGDIMKTKADCKMAAALDACKVLHQNG